MSSSDGRDFHLRLALLPAGPCPATVRVEVTDTRGERVPPRTGNPPAILSPVTEEPVPDHPTDPMGDDDIPVFHSGSRIDWSEGHTAFRLWPDDR
ncbi:hypothetical protein H114_05138 [Streptomyces gancidicus BKS 13-15]|uniref:Uncharacterized protein n=1 Tax=Streptomyces gancidicus BKS 13-15 TaxID=1284664 RepID=M3DJT7_STREZ|nr:hypothetical protein [Streptomyces gancidicus]EMF30200.1 hypothetical protein H114_05138 [Streptomyces gancidicus BKS 13-15]